MATKEEIEMMFDKAQNKGITQNEFFYFCVRHQADFDAYIAKNADMRYRAIAKTLKPFMRMTLTKEQKKSLKNDKPCKLCGATPQWKNERCFSCFRSK